MTCPICRKDSDERFRPFCSGRCADVDLGRWLGGEYSLPGPDHDDDHDDRAEAGETGPQKDRQRQ